MRRFSVVMILAILLQACSMNDILLPPADEPEPTLTPFITYTPIDTPVPTNTPLPTATATIVRLPTFDPNMPTATFEPIPIFIGMDTATPVIPATPSRPGPGFVSVSVSANKIFWGSCTPNRTVISAEVEDPKDVISVVIFVKVRSTEKDDSTPWTTGDVMFNHRDGTFTYTLRANDTRGHNHYRSSWVMFQLVATNNRGQEVGRTQIYSTAIDLAPCPCLTPLTGCPIPTPRRP